MDINAARKRAEEALERAERAAEGPWQVGSEREPSITNAGSFKIYDEGAHNYDDALFIAESRSDVPLLAQDLLEALEEIERLRPIVLETEYVAKELYAIEVNQQGIGRTVENAQWLRDTQARLVRALDGKSTEIDRWRKYTYRLQEENNKLKTEVPDRG